jgi:RNA polymerase sigma-70 factor (ECF subfamily)
MNNAACPKIDGDFVSLTHPSLASSGAASSAQRNQQLVEACLSGGARGWERFVSEFSGLMAHVVTRSAAHRNLPLSHADRDDLVADVFFEILRNDAAVLRAFAGRSSLAGYLTVVARRVAGRRLQERFRAGRAVADLAKRPQALSAAPVRGVDDRDEVAALLDGLDADEARIVRLFHIEERSYGEISRLLGIPLGSVGPVLSRARAKLRRQAS